MASHTAWSEDQLIVLAQTFPALTALAIGRCRLPALQPIFENYWQGLTELNISQSNLTSWEQLSALEHLPALNKLTICRNPLSQIPEFSRTYSGFLSLTSLNLKLCNINDMISVHNLNGLPALTRLKMSDTMIHVKFQENFRMMAVSYLPKLRYFNGGLVKDRERVSLERQFLRDYCDPANEYEHRCRSVPSLLDLLSEEEESLNRQVFARLFGVHGIVHKFAEVNLAPPIDALINFEIEGQEAVQHRIPVKWTVKQLKIQLAKLFSIAISEYSLLYGDHEIMHVKGLELLKFDNFKLHTVGFKDNDIVYIRSKRKP